MSATEFDSDPTESGRPDDNSTTHYIVTLHGIQTYGQWQDRLGALLRDAGSAAKVRHFKYGVFSVFSYFVPFLRWINVWRFRRSLEDLARANPGARIDIVAHSFGTYIAGQSLARIARKGGVRLDTVILAGSVLKVGFPWNDLLEKRVVRRVVNECGTRDDVLVWTQFLVLLTGMAGRIGFQGLLDDFFKNRYYTFGHSGYFEPFGDEQPGEPRETSFMRSQWVPILTTDAAIEDHDERVPGRLTPVEYFLLDKADPIKLLAYGSLLSALVWLVGVVPYQKLANEKIAAANARAETVKFQVRAQSAREEAERIVSTAFDSMQTFGGVVSGDMYLQSRPELAATRRKLLETAGELFGELTKQAKEAELGTDARRKLAEAYVELAQLTSEIGDLTPKTVRNAVDHFETAVGILNDLDRQHPDDPKTLWALAKALRGQGEGYLSLQKMDDSGPASRAQEPLERALRTLQALDPKQVPSQEDYRRVMAWTLINLGALDKKQASENYNKARELLGTSTAKMGLSDDYGWLLINRGSLEKDAGHGEEAKKLLVEARDIFDRLLNAAGQRVPTLRESLAWALHDLGRVEFVLKQQEARADLKRARDLFAELDREFPESGDRYKLDLAPTCKDLGEAIRFLNPSTDKGSREEAQVYLEEALTNYGRLSPEKQREKNIRITRSWAEHFLGWVLLELYHTKGNDPAAESLLTQALDHFGQALLLAPNEPEFALGYGWGYVTLGDRQVKQSSSAAMTAYEKAMKVFQDLRAGLEPNDAYYGKASEGVKRCKDALRAPGQVREAPAQARQPVRRASFQAPPDAKPATLKAPAAEPPVPVFRDGAPLAIESDSQPARFKIVEIFENASTKADVPLIWSDLISISYFRSSYQKPEGPGARMGTSVVGAPSFRPAKALLKLIPEVTRAEIKTGGPDRIRIALAGRYGTQADVSLARTYPPAAIDRSTMNLSVKFVAREPITLDRNQRGSDAFRLITLSSMFAAVDQYDANVLRYEDRGGVVRTLRLERTTPRNSHLLPREVELGTWFELVKTPGSSWFPDSPSIRVEITGRSKVPGRLGLQGYLAGSVDPNDDSLSVWVEWLDAPEILAAGKTLELDARVIATPPS
jgi:tetratricopeptide (TPR) repeat protein/pimeloyl-ACP methyl ester carboxylesterase